MLRVFRRKVALSFVQVVGHEFELLNDRFVSFETSYKMKCIVTKWPYNLCNRPSNLTNMLSKQAYALNGGNGLSSLRSKGEASPTISVCLTQSTLAKVTHFLTSSGSELKKKTP